MCRGLLAVPCFSSLYIARLGIIKSFALGRLRTSIVNSPEQGSKGHGKHSARQAQLTARHSSQSRLWSPWQTEGVLRSLAELKPETLAVMHGSSYIGQGDRLLTDLAGVIKETFDRA